MISRMAADLLNESFSMHLIHPSALVIPFLLFLFFLYKLSFVTFGKNLPPSPPKLPIIGNLHQIGATPHRSLKALSQRYGELMLLYLGSKPTLIISSKEMASQALKTLDSSFSGRPKLSCANSISYNSKDIAFAPYGEHWKRLRSICMLNLFTNKRVKSYERLRKEEVALMMEKIKKSPVVNLSKLFFTLTNDLICREALGRKYDGEGELGIDFELLIGELASVVGNQNIEDVIPWMSWINRFNGVNAKMIKVSKDFDDLLERICKEHADRAKESNGEGSESVKDFVDILLEVQRDNPKNTLDREAIKGVIFDVFAGGTHTGFVTLEWTLTEAIRHPTVMKRLQEEVRRITGDKEAVAEGDLEKMTYMKAVIKESFRLHPALPLLVPRECTENVKMNGYDIAAGTQVIINAWAIGRDPKYWEEPDKFIPERFLDSPIDFKGQHFELLPFGGGRRGCPGISLSIAGIELALANLVYRFDWGLPDGAESGSVDVSESSGSFCHKRAPLIAVATQWIPKQG